MILRDKYGWPVERIRGRWFTNIIRLILHTSLRQTWKRRKCIHPVSLENADTPCLYCDRKGGGK